MGMFKQNTRRNTFGNPSERNSLMGPELLSFIGNKSTANKLNQPYGQLQSNINFEYWYSGDSVYLQTKRGSTLILDITNESYGAALYKYNRGAEYFIWVDGATIYRSDVDGANDTDITSALTANKQTRWEMYGQDTDSALYGCNGFDGVFKISGSTPAYSAIADSPNIIDIAYDSNSGRMFGVTAGHDIHYSEIQLADAGVTELEDWGAGANKLVTQPDDGVGFKRILDFGTIGMYAWKDTGIFAVLNTDQDIVDWLRPKCMSDVGTLSPKTVERVKYRGEGGAIFLASDKTLRFFAPTLQRNAGKIPTVLDSSAKNIGVNFQNILDLIPDGFIDKCTARYHDEKYILNIPSASGTSIDTTIIVNCRLVLPKSPSEDIEQPFWFQSVNMDYNDFVLRPSANKLYGFNKNGYIAQILVNDKYYEEMPTRITPDESYEDDGLTRKVTIEYSAFTGWFNFSKVMGGGHELELILGYLHFETEGQYPVNFVLNAFKRGQAIPSFNVGLSTALTPTASGGGFFDVSQFGVATFAGDSGSVSQNIDITKKGHYFLFGFYGNIFNQPATIFGVEPIFKKHRLDPVGVR